MWTSSRWRAGGVPVGRPPRARPRAGRQRRRPRPAGRAGPSRATPAQRRAELPCAARPGRSRRGPLGPELEPGPCELGLLLLGGDLESIRTIRATPCVRRCPFPGRGALGGLGAFGGAAIPLLITKAPKMPLLTMVRGAPSWGRLRERPLPAALEA